MNPFDIGFYTEKELVSFGFKSIGKNVSIAKNCNIMGMENISIGNNVRIDGYCTIIATGNGFVDIGSFVHIGSYSMLSAGAGITMSDFSGLSQGVMIYTKSDDYTGKYLTNPMVDAEYTGVKSGTVSLGKHVIIGSGTIILPKVNIAEGVSVGAQSLVTKNLKPWGVYFGSPIKRLKDRSKEMLEKERLFLMTQNN